MMICQIVGSVHSVVSEVETWIVGRVIQGVARENYRYPAQLPQHRQRIPSGL